MVSWRGYSYHAGALKDDPCCKPFPDGPGWFLQEVVDHRWAFQLHKLSRQTVAYFGRKPTLKTRIFVGNLFLRGPSWSEGTVFKADIRSAHTSLVGLAVVKVSELQRVHFMCFDVWKVLKICIFGHGGRSRKISSIQDFELKMVSLVDLIWIYLHTKFQLD